MVCDGEAKLSYDTSSWSDDLRMQMNLNLQQDLSNDVQAYARVAIALPFDSITPQVFSEQLEHDTRVP